MRFTVNNGGIRSAAKTEILAIPLFSDDLGSTHVREVDAAAGGALSALRTIGEATGRRFSASLAAGGRLPADHLLFVGAGARSDFDRQALLRWGAAVVRRLAGWRVVRAGSLANIYGEDRRRGRRRRAVGSWRDRRRIP